MIKPTPALHANKADIQLDLGFKPARPAENTANPIQPKPTFSTPLEWFNAWLDYRMAQPAERITREAAVPYRYIWSSWCQWLLNEEGAEDWGSSVLQANAKQALEFLARQVTPATQRAGSTTDISVVTRERYCMVLRQVYDHLVRIGLIAHNPMQRLYELAGEARPDAEVLSAPVWRQLVQTWSKSVNTGSPMALRDQALIWLMLDVALTPAELSALTLGQISADVTSTAVWIRVGGARSAQTRQLELSEQSAAALRAWLAVRDSLLRDRQFDPGVEALAFFTERRRPLSRRVLFHLTSTAIEAACRAQDSELPRHLGPLVLRNTVILNWLRSGIETTEVCRRAGYQSKVSLEHLRAHLAMN